jgi:hypothetical protein
MQPGDLDKRLERKPFQPFRIYLTDGAAFDIRHPEMLMVGKRAAVIGMADDPADTHYDRSIDVDLLHVIRAEPLEAPPPPAGNGPPEVT